MAFDPCREWLGIDAVDLADPYRVLGLASGVRDAEAIGRAAAARLAALGRVAPGPFAKAHAALVAKVEEARDSLLTQAFLDAPVAAAAPAAREAIAVEPAAAPAPDGDGTVHLPPPSAMPVELDPTPVSPADDPLPGPAVRRPIARAKPASQGAGGLLLGSIALLMAAAAVLVVLMLRTDPAGNQVAVAARPSATEKRPSPMPPLKTPLPQTPPAQPPVAGGPPPGETAARGDGATRPGGVVPSPDDTAERDRQSDAAQERQRQAEARMAEEQSRRNAELAEQQAAAATAAEEARRRQAMEATAAKRQAEQDRARMQEALDKSLGEAYAALQRGEFDTATRALAAAGKHVGDDVEAATRIERWRLLATYARDFVGYREKAFAAANAGRDYTVDGKTFALIEITPAMFIYKLAGRIERVSRERVDPRIELAVVEGWFAADGRAANHLFLGARWLCLDPPNLPRAKAEWRIAGDGGEQVAPLLALLDDPVIRGAGR